MNFSKYLKNPWIVGVIIVAVIGLFLLLKPKTGAKVETVSVIRGTVTEVVSVTGRVKASLLADLGFERMGKLAHIYKNVGDKVMKGDLILALSNTDLVAGLRSAEASLAQVSRGSRREDLALQGSKYYSSQIDFAGAQSSLDSTMRQTYVSLDDAVRNKADAVFKNPRTPNPEFKYSIKSENEKLNINYRRLLVEEKLNDFQIQTGELSSATAGQITNLAASTTAYVKDFLSDLSVLVNDLSLGGDLTQTTIDSYKANLASARTNVNTAITSLISAKNAYLNASSSLSVSQGELTLKQSGSTNEDIIAAEAKLDQARAELEKSLIRAPFDGRLTRQDGVLGEIVNAGSRVATVLDDKSFEIEASVPEVDIGKVALNNPVSVTLDAFSGKVFRGHVTYIEPSETVESGVVNFKIKVIFDNLYSEIKTGLTANLDIEAQNKGNVLVLPAVAVIEDDLGSYVNKIIGNKTKKIQIKTGIRSADGNIEILSGVSEGDIVEKAGLKK